MSFEVEPEALREMAMGMRDVAFDVVYPWQYNDQWLTLDRAPGGVFYLAADFNDSVRKHLDEVFSKLMTVTSRSEEHLDSVAHYYATTDHAVERAMDRHINATHLAARYPAGPDPYSSPGDPTDTVPEDPEDD